MKSVFCYACSGPARPHPRIETPPVWRFSGRRHKTKNDPARARHATCRRDTQPPRLLLSIIAPCAQPRLLSCHDARGSLQSQLAEDPGAPSRQGSPGHQARACGMLSVLHGDGARVRTGEKRCRMNGKRRACTVSGEI